MELSVPAPTVEALAAELEALGPALHSTWDRRRDLASRVLGFASDVVSPAPRTPAERLAAVAAHTPLAGSRRRTRRALLDRRAGRRAAGPARFARTSAVLRRLVPPSVDSHRSAWSTGSLYSIGSASSILSFCSAVSFASFGSVLSVGSAGSVLSIGSAGSVLSIGSAGSVLAIGGAGVNNLTRARDAVATPGVVRAVNLLAIGGVIAAAGTSRS